jgi:hypothetical protein
VKVCLIWCGSMTAAWSVGDGLANALNKAGNHVLRIPRGRRECPLVTVEALNLADVIIVSGPEHILRSQVKGELPTPYAFSDREVSLYEWKNEVKPPKIFMYHETNRREDQNFGFEDYLQYGDYHFFPAIQDAETFDQEHFAKGRSFWLPFGVDTDVFKPLKCPHCDYGLGTILGVREPKSGETMFQAQTNYCKVCLGSRTAPSPKDIDVGFIGLIYPKRHLYLESLARHVKDGDPIPMTGNVQVLDIDGLAYHDQAMRLAMNYRRIKVFLNLPAYSELITTKVVEVMACGSFMLTPMLEGAAEPNCIFVHGKELAYYRPSNLPFLVQTWREFVDRDQLRESIATAGMMRVRETLSLKKQIAEIFYKTIIERAKTATIQ